MKQQEKTNGYAHILKYMGVFGSVQGVTIGLGVIRNKLVAVLIGPAGVGIISLFGHYPAYQHGKHGVGR